jgi:hypothetical protein
MLMLERWTSRVVRGWLFVEALALELKGYNNESEDDWRRCHASDNHASCEVNVTSPQHALLATPEDAVDEEKGGHERVVPNGNLRNGTPFPSFRSPSWVPRSRMRRLALNLFLLFSTAALIAYYALVHIRYIQEDGVWHTSWFYEWFLIPILLSFSFAAPLHRALGYHDCGTSITRQDYEKCQQRLELLQKDHTTQWLIVAVATCYVTYIVGDVAFFIPISPYSQVISTWPIYLLAVTTNIGFIYQAFLLTILTMRAFCVRLQEVERDIATVVASTTISACNNNNNNVSTPVVVVDIISDKVTHWVDCYEELRNHMQSVSRHFGFRMVLGLTMFVVETSNLILSVWSSVGSTLTATQTVCLLLTYMASAVMLILTVFYTAHTATICAQSIAPRLAILSLRTHGNNHNLAAVLAQAFVQMPIRLQTGNFNVTSEYANALTAWLFGLFLVVFGMKLPQV